MVISETMIFLLYNVYEGYFWLIPVFFLSSRIQWNITVIIKINSLWFTFSLHTELSQSDLAKYLNEEDNIEGIKNLFWMFEEYNYDTYESRIDLDKLAKIMTGKSAF